MPIIRASLALSLDGFGAGPRQSLENPLGEGGEALHDWAIATRTFQRMFGDRSGGTTASTSDFAARGMANVGAWILGRNMFGPVRGPWPDESWNGWWGDEPPYHCPVFVLTHHPRQPLEMKGGTMFHFVTGGIESPSSKRARRPANATCASAAAPPRCASISRPLIDELHLAISPVVLGPGSLSSPASTCRRAAFASRGAPRASSRRTSCSRAGRASREAPRRSHALAA